MKSASRQSKHRRRRILLAMNVSAVTTRWNGIARYAREAGWILESRLFAFRYHNRHSEYLNAIKFDGILSIIGKDDPELESIVTRAGVPVVDLWQEYPELKLPRVVPDHIECGKLAARHLIDLGIKNLLYYSHIIDRPATAIRCQGFGEMAAEHGIQPDVIWWDAGKFKRKGSSRAKWLGEQLKKLKLPLGVMTGNDSMASDVVDAAEYAGLRVPEDVAIVSSDNDPIMAELGVIPISSVDIARERIGYEAAALLDRIIDGEKPPREPILIPPARVVIRRSTEILAVADPDVIKAIRFIQEHFRKPIAVSDIVGSTFLSRRRLQDRFIAELGHGMNQEVARHRIQFSQQLLTDSKHKISTIALMSGFASVHRMSKVYKRYLGMTPQAFRQQHYQNLAR